jgi:hypothetical protein
LVTVLARKACLAARLGLLLGLLLGFLLPVLGGFVGKLPRPFAINGLWCWGLIPPRNSGYHCTLAAAHMPQQNDGGYKFNLIGSKALWVN